MIRTDNTLLTGGKFDVTAANSVSKVEISSVKVVCGTNMKQHSTHTIQQCLRRWQNLWVFGSEHLAGANQILSVVQIRRVHLGGTKHQY